MFEKVRQVLKEFEVQKEVFLSRQIKSTVQKTLGSPEIKNLSDSDFLYGTFTSNVSEKTIKKFEEALSSQKIKTQFLRQPLLGKLFQSYGAFYNLDNGEKVVLQHKQGEVLCLSICSLKYVQSIQSLDYIQKLVQKHSHWRERVRMLTVIADGQKSRFQKEALKRKWNLLVKIVSSNDNYDNHLHRDFRIWGPPVIILVDRSGKIYYAGSFYQIDIQKRINLLIQMQNQNEHSKVAQELSLSEEEALKYLASLYPERVEDHFKEIDLFCFQLQVNIYYTNSQTSTRGKIKAAVINNDQAAFDKANEFFGNYPGIDLKIKSVDYITVPSTEGVRCWQCSQHLEYPFYWLKWEEGTKFGCRRCVEETTTLESHHFKYEKNSILLMGEWKKFAVKNIGSNKQPIHPKQIKNLHCYSCDGCGTGQSQIGKARYICQGCFMDPNPYHNCYRDFCEGCLEKSVINQLNFSQQLNLSDHQFNHPFLRVLYNIKGYQLF